MAKKKRRLKSWQRRRLRRIKMFISATFLLVLVIVGIILFKASLPYEKVDLCDYVTYEYSGYNNKGTVEATINETLLSGLMQRLVTSYDDANIHYTKCEPGDYNAFYNSLDVTVYAPQYLSNGSKFTYKVSYDTDLAKKIKLDVSSDTREVMVDGLVTAAVFSIDDLFEGISFSYEGISPSVKATMSNNTTNPYLQDIVFNIEGEQEFYSEGDIIRVRASFSEEECLEKHFVIDGEQTECFKDYVVTSTSRYVTSADKITKELLREAVAAANKSFTTASAKEFGVRVFIEAGLMPIYINKESTFEWVSYNPVSAYFKVANADIAGKAGNNYNILDLIYTANMTQADGKTANVECVVRFKDIIENDDGTLTYDFSNAAIIGCSHMDSRVKKTVIGNYESNHTITKLSF